MTNELMQKVAEVAPDTYQFLLDTAPAIQTSPFKDEVLAELDGLMKNAGVIGGVGQQLGVNIGSGIAMALAGDMYNAIKRGITKGTYYKAMLDANPDLKKMPAHDVQNAFNTLHQFNPEFASNPHVAGSYVRKNSQFPEFDATQLSSLVSSHKNISDSKKLPSSHIDVTNFDPADRTHKELQTKKLLQEMGHESEMHPLRKAKAQGDFDAQSPKLKALEQGLSRSDVGMVARSRAYGTDRPKKREK